MSDTALSDPAESFIAWFLRYWSRVTLPLAAILLLLTPFLLNGLGEAGFLAFLLLPVYMIHQYEEHAHGRFKADIDSMLASRLLTISNVTIFWVNVGLVWGTYLATLYLVYFVDLAFGLVMAYGTLLNGLLHIGMALRLHKYNAGLWTALTLFLPVGGFVAFVISADTQAAFGFQLFGIAMAALLHVITFAAIIKSARPASSSKVSALQSQQ